MAAPPNPRSAGRPGRQRKKASPPDTRQQDNQQQGERDKVTLILSGGAPHAPLMAGALANLYAKGKTFDHIWAAGAGGIVGLVYIAPKNGSPYEALEGMLDMSIDDAIYRWFPVNYKIFKKSSPFHHAFESWGKLWKLPVKPDRPPTRYRRLYNDWVELWVSMLTPSDLNFHSKGLCEPLPFLEDLIAFDRVLDWPGGFFLNAYNLTENEMEVFPKPVIDPLHVRAATAASFLYPPVQIGAHEYREGAFHDPLFLEGLRQEASKGGLNTQTIVLSDLLSREKLLQSPENIWDAYGQSIIEPVVSLAQEQLENFKHKVRNSDTKLDFLELEFRLPQNAQPYVLDWSYSNMRRLWEFGMRAGEKFFTDHGDRLPNVSDLAPWPNTDPAP